MTKVAVLSHIVIDEVFDADRAPVGIEVGGAGAYAAVGASLAGADGEAFLVSGAGRDDRAFLADWCLRRQISPAGLFEVGVNSPRTRIDYFDDGERAEIPVHGLEHFEAHTPFPRDIPAEAKPVDGMYLFHDHDPAYWTEVTSFAEATGPRLWEISSDACRPGHRDAVWQLLETVDILSINEAEARALLGVTDLSAVSETLLRAGVTVLLRLGARGSLVLHQGRIHRVGAAPTRALDPTGGGNSYTGAFLAAYARTGDLRHAARIAAAAASAVVAAPGSPEIDDAVRRKVAAVAETVSFTLA